MNHNIQLLIIDPQNDFCDLPADWCPLDPLTGQPLAPALPVAGAHADMQRVARFIDAASARLDGITVTLDSHHRIDIAHPTFWQQRDGAAVGPFTQITAAQVRAGDYRPRDAAALPRTLAYLDELEARGRYTLMVWPVHCEIGSWGHNVHAAVRAAYNRWEEATLTEVQKVVKGDNPWTEHYSAVQAEVPDLEDPDTQLNRELIDRLDAAGLILVAGEASSHCVKATTEHVVAQLSGRLERVVLLTDCMSPVGGFQAQHEAFLADMRSRGVQLATSTDLLQRLQSA
ncbi:cysteine hydrolase [Eleftheria terrae]|uniref:cysteine hydrolase n=1 Tax=Eleftheria terrae TaxID=1597781 RepID=UPI00263B19F9|nr:cysteine hydrolase [Eleftheria terrae]WKB52493.1 cysteine hydrolase [Eleftheria terrae]